MDGTKARIRQGHRRRQPRGLTQRYNQERQLETAWVSTQRRKRGQDWSVIALAVLGFSVSLVTTVNVCLERAGSSRSFLGEREGETEMGTSEEASWVEIKFEFHERETGQSECVLLNGEHLKRYPMFKRGTGLHSGNHVITVVTQLSIDRLDRLELLTQTWDGPVSAAVYLCESEELRALETWYRGLDSELKRWLDIHLYVDRNEFYPINALRNFAYDSMRENGGDGFSFILDADARPNANMKTYIADLEEAIRLVGNSTGWVFVVPAFEWSDQSGDLGIAVPSDKGVLRDYFGKGIVRPMHEGRRSYSGPFDHKRWLDMDEDDGFMTVQYEVMFEPYYIRSRGLSRSERDRGGVVRFPEEFVGRGFNKQSHHFQMWASGFNYLILSKSFVVDFAFLAQTNAAKAFEDNRKRWQSFRGNIEREYGLECRQMYWRQCDKSGKNCDKVCQRTRQDRSRLRDDRDYTASRPEPKPSRRGKKRDEHASREKKWWDEFENLLNARAKSGVVPERESRRELHDRLPLDTNCTEIDVVYTWVNGSDPWHQSVQRKYIPASAFEDDVDLGGRHWSQGGVISMKAGDLAFRFRDFGRASTLRFSLRSFLKYAPWVRKFWIVAAGIGGDKDNPQTPSWLDLAKANGRTEMVSHEKIFADPENQLPTLNSCAIETRLHRIPGLSECYIYVNDDFLLLRSLSRADLWNQDQTPSLPFATFNGERAPRIGKDPWQRKVANVARMIRHELGTPWEQIFLVGHHGHFFIKSIVQALEARFQTDFDRTAGERWRTPESIWVPFVYSNYYAWNYRARPKRIKALYHRLTNAGGAQAINKAFSDLFGEDSWEWACFNDLLASLTPEIEQALFEGFTKLFPEKAPFER